jgi:hypothetical protein
MCNRLNRMDHHRQHHEARRLEGTAYLMIVSLLWSYNFDTIFKEAPVWPISSTRLRVGGIVADLAHVSAPRLGVVGAVRYEQYRVHACSCSKIDWCYDAVDALCMTCMLTWCVIAIRHPPLLCGWFHRGSADRSRLAYISQAIHEWLKYAWCVCLMDIIINVSCFQLQQFAMLRSTLPRNAWA